MLLGSTMWYDDGENVGTTDMYEKTLELEEKIASSAIHLIPPCIRFGLIRVIIESRRAMQLT